MKLLLIQPPVADFYDTDVRLQPIGLCYLKAAVNKFLPQVSVLVRDFHQGCGRKTVTIPKELRYLREYYAWPDKSPFCTFHHYYHFGAAYEDIADAVVRYQPDIVGISSLFSPYYREVLKTVDAIKARVNVPIILGGSHVSAMPEMMLAHPTVDYVIVGEGERPLVELLRALSGLQPIADVPNLGYKLADATQIFTPRADNYPMAELPIADITDLDQRHYQLERKPLSFIVTSRSCPHRCTFCSVHNTFGHTYRRHEVGRVLEEIALRYKEGIRAFDFEDDNLTYYKPAFKELCRALIDRYAPGELQLVAMNGISYLSLDDELLQLMHQAGFTHLNLSLVSSDKSVRQSTKRPHTIEKYLQVVRTAHALGLHIVSYQILGLPGESLASMIQTLQFAAMQPVLIGASMFYLTPNSPIAKQFPPRTEADIFKARLTAMAIETEEVSRDDIYTLFVTTRILNFIKGLTVPSADITLDELITRPPAADARTTLGFELLGHLLSTSELLAATAMGRQPLKRFDMQVFRQVLRGLPHITTQQGACVYNSACDVQLYSA